MSNDPFITESWKKWDDKCDADDAMSDIIDQRVEDMLKEGDISLIADAFDDSHELAELYKANRGDMLNLGEILDRRVKAYLREIAERDF